MNVHPIRAGVLCALVASTTCLAAKAEEFSPQGEPNGSPIPAEAEQTAEKPDEKLGLSFGLSWFSAYAFRGWNLFQDSSQADQNMLVSPYLTWDIMGSGLEVGYWSGYQVSGNNIRELIDSGLGAEQDLFVTYTWEMTDWASLTPTLIFYLYPFADKDVAGTSMPGYVDPMLDLCLKWAVDFGMKVSYYTGLQKETSETNYLYLSPSVSRSFSLGKHVGLHALFSLGYKLWQDRSISENTWDVLFDLGLPIALNDRFTITPRFQAVWTNLDNKLRTVVDPSNPTDPVTFEGAKRQEGFAVGGIDLSVSL
jgi:hypothetical protein